jgi:hypothetical protein
MRSTGSISQRRQRRRHLVCERFEHGWRSCRPGRRDRAMGLQRRRGIGIHRTLLRPDRQAPSVGQHSAPEQRYRPDDRNHGSEIVFIICDPSRRSVAMNVMLLPSRDRRGANRLCTPACPQCGAGRVGDRGDSHETLRVFPLPAVPGAAADAHAGDGSALWVGGSRDGRGWTVDAEFERGCPSQDAGCPGTKGSINLRQAPSRLLRRIDIPYQ